MSKIWKEIHITSNSNSTISESTELVYFSRVSCLECSKDLIYDANPVMTLRIDISCSGCDFSESIGVQEIPNSLSSDESKVIKNLIKACVREKVE